MKKKKLSKTQKKEIRLRKARQWITTYNGSPQKIVKHYRERFHLDCVTAARDLQEIGVEFSQEYLDRIKKSEQERILNMQRERAKKEQEHMNELYSDSDDTFCFIAGYTDGGVPYGVTWEELGLDPYAPYEEIMEAYNTI